MINVTVVAFPRRISAPTQGGLHGRARTRGAFEHPQCQLKRGALLGYITRLSGITQGKIAEQKARHATVLHNILGTTHHHCRNAVGFQMAGDQTHGLVAYWSIRHQDGGIGSVLLTAV